MFPISKPNERIRSLVSTEVAQLDIHNETQYRVEVVWINYDSKMVRYKILNPDERFNITTYKTHPWIFREFVTGRFMHVNHKRILWPEASTPENPIQTVNIHFPLLSLKSVAMWKIIENLRKGVDFKELELPISLRNELYEIYCKTYVRRQFALRGTLSWMYTPLGNKNVWCD